MDIILIFIILQIILLPQMALHDWVHLPPLTDIRELEKHSTKKGRLINSIIFAFLIIIPLGLTYYCQPDFSFLAKITIFNFYFLLTIGTIFSWWLPYFFKKLHIIKMLLQSMKILIIFCLHGVIM